MADWELEILRFDLETFLSMCLYYLDTEAYKTIFLEDIKNK